MFAFKCSLKSGRLRRITRRVLAQIRRRAPEDFRRLGEKVLCFGPLPEDELQDGTTGEAVAVPPTDPSRLYEAFCRTSDPEKRRRLLQLMDDRWSWPRNVLLWDGPYDDDVTDSYLTALVAHELGHVATTDEDFKKREGVNSGWVSESCAAFYVYKWGFGRDCAKARKQEDFGHHGPAPGRAVEYQGKWYRVTRHFYIHEVDEL